MWTIGSPSTLVSPCLTPGERKGYICAISSSPDGRFFAVLRNEGELQIWKGGTQHLIVGATRTYLGANTDSLDDKSSSSSLIRHSLVWRGDSSAICCFELKSQSLCFFSVVAQEEEIPVMKLTSAWNEPQTHLAVNLRPLFALIAPPLNPGNSMIQRTSLPSPPTAMTVLSKDNTSMVLVGCTCGALLIIKFDGSIFRVFPSSLLPNTQPSDKGVCTNFMERLSCSRQPGGLLLVGAVLSDGRAWACLLSIDLSEVLYTFTLKGPTGATNRATSIGVQGGLLAVGWWSNVATVYVYRLKSDSGVGTPWKVCEHLKLGLEAWGWGGTGAQPSNVGAAHLTSFSSTGDVLMVGYTRRGMAVWDCRQGARLFTTLPDLSPESVHGVGEDGDVGVIAAPSYVSATDALGCGGVSCMTLSNLGYQLVVVPAHCEGEGDQERDTCMVVMNLLRGNGGDCTLTSHTSVAVLDRIPSKPSADLNSARFRWRLVPMPQHYAAANAPIRFVAMSEQGHVAACGRRGLALLHQCSPTAVGTPGGDRWRLFGNAQEERGMCALACAFAGDMLVLCNARSVEVYPRQRLDGASLIASAPLEEIVTPVFLQVLHDDTSTMVLVADHTHFMVFELEHAYSDGKYLYSSSKDDNPYQLTKHYEGHFDSIPKTVLLARKAGRVVVVVLDVEGSLSSMDPYENSRQTVARDITEIWAFPHSYAPLSPMFLLLERSVEECMLRAWMPLLPEMGSPVLLPVDRDEKVIAPLTDRAVLVTVRHEVDRSVTGHWHCPPLHEPQPVFRPVLGAPLRLLVQEAVSMGVHRRHLTDFVGMFAQNSATQAGLAMALEHLVVDTCRVEWKQEVACLLDVMWHEANFCFHAVVASAARQMDPSRSTLLFSSKQQGEHSLPARPLLCHSPATLCRDCIAKGLSMSTAASYLALMGPPEPNTAALSIALEVLEALLRQHDSARLVQEVWAFLGRHVAHGKHSKIVIDEEGCLLSPPSPTSREEVLCVFVVRNLQLGHITAALRPLEASRVLLRDGLFPCSVMSSQSSHQQLMSALLSLEHCHLSTLKELPTAVRCNLTTLLKASESLHYHVYHLAALTVLGDKEGVEALIAQGGGDRVDMETYVAVLDALHFKSSGYWSEVVGRSKEPTAKSHSAAL